jgi:hypothetical protein
MPNLKPYYDAAIKADAEVKRILSEMDTLFNDGTDEGKKKALELRPALDEAKAKAKEANEMYASVRDASAESDNASSLFSAPADPAAQSDQADTPKVMNRAAFNALSPKARLAFSQAGGKLTE